MLLMLRPHILCPHFLCFQQMHADVATGLLCAELQDGVAAVDQLVSELQQLNRKLGEQ